MNWFEKWKALAARIEGVAEAGKYFSLTLTGLINDHGRVVKKRINPELIAINDELMSFLNNNKDIPLQAKKSLELKKQAGDKFFD